MGAITEHVFLQTELDNVEGLCKLLFIVFFPPSIYHSHFLQTTEEIKVLVEPGAHSGGWRHGAVLHPQAASTQQCPCLLKVPVNFEAVVARVGNGHVSV